MEYIKNYNIYVDTQLLLIQCVCHSIELAVSFATDELSNNLDFLIGETYNWFSYS